MKNILLFILVIALGIFAYYKFFKTKDPKTNTNKETPMVVKTHSADFNGKVDTVVLNYENIKAAFVNADIEAVKSATKVFIQSLDAIPLAELDKDKVAVSETAKASIEDVKSNANSILNQDNITEMRKDFAAVSDMMYPAFFKSINYEGQTIYLEHCPMAFEDGGANWISTNSEIVNPYMGTSHPKYKGTMLACGEVKDSITAGK